MQADDNNQETVLQDQQDEISEQLEDEDKELDDELDVHENAKEGGRRGVNTSTYKKLTTLLAVFAILIGFILSTYQATQTGKSKVVYANRYSKEHKFRPAASPIVTETLKDGRIRIRGAEPTMSAPPPNRTTNPKPKRKRKVAKKKAASKKAKAS
ncbi:hypothetical protein M378DRAFT_178691 [Amanita muscaria Koide BX008]|uniref:Uncharacterized protein n=1 Tax=Amanita muscaria (strain Koide BX008) TaxID=946122 RepID=A0A0C2X672_AMAMK|nr:hypothetical protein M378DRAFT_178691 [Amanita muscaria Koide BX008]